MGRCGICLGCGRPTLNGSRCATCAGGMRTTRDDARYDDPRYVRLRRQRLDEHRRNFGPRCPRCGRPEDGSVARRLTLDHTTPLGLGGDILGPTTVCCTSCNSRQAHIDRPELRLRGRRPRR